MKASLLHSNNYRVNFTLMTGEYQNIMVFMYDHDIKFASEMLLDFSKIPIQLHGRGNSHNLIEYLSNNNDNNTLLFDFLNYFIHDVIDIKYENGNHINFTIIKNVKWQNMIIIISSQPPSTTNFLVTENGYRIVTENGDYIII